MLEDKSSITKRDQWPAALRARRTPGPPFRLAGTRLAWDKCGSLNGPPGLGLLRFWWFEKFLRVVTAYEVDVRVAALQSVQQERCNQNKLAATVIILSSSTSEDSPIKLFLRLYTSSNVILWTQSTCGPTSPARCLFSPAHGHKHSQWTLDDCVEFIERMAKSRKGSMSVKNIDLVIVNFLSNFVSGSDMLRFGDSKSKI